MCHYFFRVLHLYYKSITKTITSEIALDTESSDELMNLRISEKQLLELLEIEMKELSDCEEVIRNQCVQIDFEINGTDYDKLNPGSCQTNDNLIRFFDYAQAGMEKNASDVAISIDRDSGMMNSDLLRRYLDESKKNNKNHLLFVDLDKCDPDDQFIWAVAKIKIGLSKIQLSHIDDDLRKVTSKNPYEKEEKSDIIRI